MNGTITSRDIEYLSRRSEEFGTLTPRELQIYLAGQADGKSIKADEVQPRLAKLEMEIHNHGILFLS